MKKITKTAIMWNGSQHIFLWCK